MLTCPIQLHRLMIGYHCFADVLTSDGSSVAPFVNAGSLIFQPAINTIDQTAFGMPANQMALTVSISAVSVG